MKLNKTPYKIKEKAFNCPVTESRINELALIVEASFEAVEVSDKSGVIQYVNPAWEKTTGWKSEEVVGKSTSKILKSGIYNKNFYREVLQTISKGKTYQAELINKRKDGSLYLSE